MIQYVSRYRGHDAIHIVIHSINLLRFLICWTAPECQNVVQLHCIAALNSLTVLIEKYTGNRGDALLSVQLWPVFPLSMYICAFKSTNSHIICLFFFQCKCNTFLFPHLQQVGVDKNDIPDISYVSDLYLLFSWPCVTCNPGSLWSSLSPHHVSMSCL